MSALLILIPIVLLFIIALLSIKENENLKRREKTFEQIFRENKEFFASKYPNGKIF